DAGDAQEGIVRRRETMALLRIFRPGEFEKRRGRYKAAVVVLEAPALGLEIEHRTPARADRRKAEPHRRQLDAIARWPDHRGGVANVDLVVHGQVEVGLDGGNAQFDRLHGLAIGLVGDVLLDLVTHPASLAARPPQAPWRLSG